MRLADRSPSLRRSLLITMGLMAAGAVVYAVEVSCRIYLKRVDPDPIFYQGLMTLDQPPLDYGLRPSHTTNHASNGREVLMTANSQGFRYRSELETPKPAGLVRIFVLGGSAAFGLYVFEDEAFAGLLETYLRQAMGRVEVVIAAVPGYNTRQEQQMLIHRVLPFEPDMVILYNGYNDLANAISSGTRLTADGWENEMSKQFRLRKGLAERSGGRFLASDQIVNSGIYRMFRYVRYSRSRAERPERIDDLPGAAEGDQIQFRDPGPEMIENYKHGVEEMARAVRAHGVEMIVAAQPNLFYGSNWRQPREEDMLDVETVRRPGMATRIRDFTPHYVRAAQEASAAAGVRFLDLTESFKNSRADCFLDLVHLTPYGHMIVADRILREIEATRANPPPAGLKSFSAVREDIAVRLAHPGGFALTVPLMMQICKNRITQARFRDATACFRRVLEFQPDQGEASQWLSKLDTDTSNPMDEIGILNEMLRRKPNDVATLGNLSMAYAKRGQNDLAIPTLEKLIQIRPDDLKAHLVLGTILAKLGRRDEAVGHLTKAVKLKPLPGEDHYQHEAWYQLALVHLKAGRRDAAIEIHGRLKLSDPERAAKLEKQMGSAE